MNKKQSKRQRDIKTKLMAAICMLLVSSIMMVSTTYAWFTLSTAPEVTGISTAVGANGNLEMALMPKNGQTSSITSNVGDSMAHTPDPAANVTWGNLVDLSDSSYGLDKIALYPSQLNADGGKLSANPLSTPVYGADGRVSELKASTITGTFDGTKFVEKIADTNGKMINAKGVRAVGTSSTLTDRELAYRALMSEASSAGAMAQKTASGALSANGNTLANVAINHATKENATITPGERSSMLAICTALLGNDTTTGSLKYIETALKQYIAAHNVATASDSSYADMQAAILKADLAALTEGSVKGEKATYTITLPTDVAAMITKLNTAIANVTEAQKSLTDLGEQTSYEWDDVDDALYKLANPDAMEVNGIPVNKIKEGDNMSTLVSAVMGEGLKLSLGTGSGVFADIADFAGDYSCTITIDQISYGGLTVPNVPATMSTKTTVSPAYLSQASTNTAKFTAGGAGDSNAATAITDYYGYIIDLAFRTNVAGSYLQLQADAVDRVYSDGTNTDTMGGGASMSFTATTTAFDAYVSSLMQHIRVVFFNPSTSNIIGYARLDSSTATTDANGKVTMQLVMTDAAGTATGSARIMDLDQNTIHQLSVLVYLDGTTITNKDVSNAAKSVIGTMNLQFSSSATLVPMEYSDLKNGTGTTTSSKTITLNNVNSDALGVGVRYAVYKDGTVGIVLGGTPTTAGTLQATVGNTTYPLTANNIQNGEQTLSGYTFTLGKDVTIEAATRIILSVQGTTSTSYTVTLPAGVTGAETATANTAYTFTVSDSYTLGKVTVGGTVVTPTDNGGGTYTIPAASVTGNIVIAATQN